jgi:hypothetical protein
MFNAWAFTLAASLHAMTSAHAVVMLVPQTVVAGAVQPDNLEPDRPDVTNGTHIVDVGLLQMEVGGIWNRPGIGRHSVSTPTSLRLGLSERLEARVSGDGFLAVTDASGSQRGIGNVQLGAKLRSCEWSRTMWNSPAAVADITVGMRIVVLYRLVDGTPVAEEVRLFRPAI